MVVKSEEGDIKPWSNANHNIKSKPRHKVTNQDLPPEYLKNDAWRALICSLIRYVATTSQVFSMTDASMIRALTVLCNYYYSETGIVANITNRSPEFLLVNAYHFCRALRANRKYPGNSATVRQLANNHRLGSPCSD